MVTRVRAHALNWQGSDLIRKDVIGKRVQPSRESINKVEILISIFERCLLSFDPADLRC
jgi:hypothetical protein